MQGIAKTEPVRNDPVENSDQSEFLLTCLRVASLRAKLTATELDSIGVALRHNFVSLEGAFEWLHALNLLDHVLYRELAHDQI
jgi:hypothetical protein